MNRISFFSATAAAALGFLLAALGSGWYAILVWIAIAMTAQSQRVVDFVQDFLDRRTSRMGTSSSHHAHPHLSESEARE